MIISQNNFYWTEHAKIKMRQYRLSEARVKRVLRFPKRIEVGIAPGTTAVMQPAGSKQHPYEIWVMWFLAGARDKTEAFNNKKNFNFNKQIKIISAWRYPGVSPIHEPPPIPDDVLEMIKKLK
jgi:hypothetical protein